MAQHSIGRRLILFAGVWVLTALIIAGVVLTELFRNHVEDSFDAELIDHLAEVLRLTEVDGEGRVSLKYSPADPEYQRPFSGFYWQIRTEGFQDRSRSLWDQTLPFPAQPSSADPVAFNIEGPAQQTLRVLVRRFHLPRAGAPVDILVAGPQKRVDQAVREFASVLGASMLVLGLGLLAAVALQVRFGLRPLRAVQARLAAIRKGEAGHLGDDFPTEIAPLATELDQLLDHNAEVIARARTQAGNLAHALKTPLSVITNEAAGMSGEAGTVLRTQAKAMLSQIDWHLRRARAAGALGVLGVRADVAPIAAGLVRTIARIHQDRGLRFEQAGLEGHVFRGESQDLEEMLGNLIDNAAKWAKGRVRLTVWAEGETVCFEVADDGPGIPDDKLTKVLGRGQRLDETVPGSGLGLAIVRDVADLYGGSLKLGRSDLGGLAATLVLPGE